MLKYFHGTKYEFFLPPCQIIFFLVFDQVTDQKTSLDFNEHS